MSVDSRYARHEVFCGRLISKRRFQIALFIAAALTAGCEAQNQPPTPSPAPSAASRKIDEWIGRWNGPEGTYLEISKSGDTYEMQIKDLDKVQTYRGTATSDGVSFERNGKAENIRSGNGERTGMKWLANKKDCLVIQKSEGYCRD
jgi:hypothetical protein